MHWVYGSRIFAQQRRSCQFKKLLFEWRFIHCRAKERLNHAKSVPCIISIITDVPAVDKLLKLYTLTNRFTSILLLQLPYCVSMLLLTSVCKSAPASACYWLVPVFQKSTLLPKTKVTLYKPVSFVTVKYLIKSYTVVIKQSTSVTKVGVAYSHSAFIKKLSFR